MTVASSYVRLEDVDKAGEPGRHEQRVAIKEPPRPLRRPMPPADPYPVEALGNVLRPAALGINERIQAPIAICAQSVLAVATLATQAHADIELPTGQTRPLTNFLVTVAETGERKSSADNEALCPVHKHEAAMRRDYDAKLAGYENARAAWSKARDHATAATKGKAGPREMSDALDALGPAPAAPLTPMLTCPDPTIEGLCRLLAGGHPSLGVFSAEAGQFIGGHGMTPENRLKTAAALSAVWDGIPIRRVRAGDGAIILPGRRVAMHLMAQPGVAGRMLADRLLADQGLLSRLLVSAPASTAGTRLWRDPSPEAEAAIKQYGARILARLEAPLPLAAGTQNELTPRVLRMNGAARRAWIGFADHVEPQLAPGAAFDPIRGFANKLPEHAARLAGVLALVADLDASELREDHLAAGVALAEHYAAEALRLFDAGAVAADVRSAELLRAWLRHEWLEPLISLPDVYQFGPNAIRDAAAARRAVELLAEHGWLEHQPTGGTVNGIRRRDVWRVIR